MKNTLAALTLGLSLTACAASPTSPVQGTDFTPDPYVKLTSAEWTRDAVIYQLNTRQFTAEGTFRAAQGELPRLRDLGVDIIWLMPIHPIGEVNRKGTLGSPYSVKDYFGVNPEFGTEEDFQAFVDEAHRLGMRVILDWVANHTAWDNELAIKHPDWYEKDWKGDFRPTPWWDWSDIIDIDFNRVEVRQYMASAMRYWVEEFGVDGYRADVAGYIPLDFWEDVRADLETIRPVFMLAEWDQRDAHQRAFDATYAWPWKDATHAIAKGRADTGALFGYYSGNESAWPREAMRMTYTENHDQNSWDGSVSDLFGDSYEAFLVLSFVGEGIPLIYNGQEVYNTKRLEFFEKDPIDWDANPDGAARIDPLLRSLIALKTDTSALWNGAWGARMVPVVNTVPQRVLSFARMDGNGGVFAVFNLSPEPQSVRFTDGPYAGDWTEHFTGAPATLTPETTLALTPWSYRVYRR